MKKIFILIIGMLSLLLCACSSNTEQDKLKDGNIIDESKKNAENTEEISLAEENIIQSQSFDIELSNWGKVRFVSYAPDNSNDFEDVSFYLTKDSQVIYRFPYYCENNSTENYMGLYDSVAAVDFRDINQDGMDDVIIIINYITGAGPQGMVPRPSARIFLAEKEGFYIAEDIINDISDNIEEKDLTIDNIYNYVTKTLPLK